MHDAMIILITIPCLWATVVRGQELPRPVVEVEEVVSQGQTALSCFGSGNMVRHGEDVFVTMAVFLPEVPRLNNVQWLLFKRTAQGWELQQQAERKDLQSGDTLLGLFSDGRLLMRTNPPKTLGARSGPAKPHLLQFLATQPKARPTPTYPA
jgi:hypothetical protein